MCLGVSYREFMVGAEVVCLGAIKSLLYPLCVKRVVFFTLVYHDLIIQSISLSSVMITNNKLLL